MMPSGKKIVVLGVLVIGSTGALLVEAFVTIYANHADRTVHHARRDVTRKDPPAANGVNGASASEARSPVPSVSRSPPEPIAARAATGEPGAMTGAEPADTEGEYVLSTVTPEVAAVQTVVAERLDGAVKRNPGNEVAFIDCADRPCRARATAKDLPTLTAFLRDVSGTYDGHLAVELRERLDPFMGRSYEADLLVGTKDSQPVPTEPSTLQ